MQNEKFNKKNMKFALIAILVILTVIIFLQNLTSVETHFLFMTTSMPMVLLLLITFLLGFATGMLIASHMSKKTKK